MLKFNTKGNKKKVKKKQTLRVGAALMHTPHAHTHKRYELLQSDWAHIFTASSLVVLFHFMISRIRQSSWHLAYTRKRLSTPKNLEGKKMWFWPQKNTRHVKRCALPLSCWWLVHYGTSPGNLATVHKQKIAAKEWDPSQFFSRLCSYTRLWLSHHTRFQLKEKTRRVGGSWQLCGV